MKRFLSISLLSLYLLSSVGLVISLHYCGGNLAALKLFVQASCCCDDDQNNQKKDCCKDEIKSIKISDDQIKVNHEQTIFHADEFLSPFKPKGYSFSQNVVLSSLQATQLPRPPDGLSEVPAYKKNHCLLFYS